MAHDDDVSARPARAATASSAVSLAGTGRPRRMNASTVISATARESSSRLATAEAEKPEKIGTTSAPIAATA